jgi:hypothetical protein
MSEAINLVTSNDFIAFDAYVSAVVAEIKVQGYDASATKQEFGGNITPGGVNTAPNISFPFYSWIVNIPSLNIGVMLNIVSYKDYIGGDPIKEAHRRIELAGGTLKTAVVVPQPKQDPSLVQGIPFEEPIGSGNYYKINPFGMKTSCRAPVTGSTVKVDPVIAIRGYIGSKLGEQPPQSDETVTFVESILGFMAKL